MIAPVVLERLTAACTSSTGDQLPDDASTTIRVGDLRDLLQYHTTSNTTKRGNYAPRKPDPELVKALCLLGKATAAELAAHLNQPPKVISMKLMRYEHHRIVQRCGVKRKDNGPIKGGPRDGTHHITYPVLWTLRP